MTEQELITSMQALTSGAQSVLQAIMAYGSQASGTVTFQIGGSTYTIKSLQQQITDNATQQAADRLAFIQSFNGVPIGQTVTRNARNQIASVVTTFNAGYTATEVPARDPVTGRILSVTVTCKDAIGNVIATATKTIVRANGLYSGVI